MFEGQLTNNDGERLRRINVECYWSYLLIWFGYRGSMFSAPMLTSTSTYKTKGETPSLVSFITFIIYHSRSHSHGE
jgi:hypothetical protein